MILVKNYFASKKPIVIIGESALEIAKMVEYIFEELKDFLFKNNFINENWNAFNILFQNASAVGAMDLKFLNYTRRIIISLFFDKLKR